MLCRAGTCGCTRCQLDAFGARAPHHVELLRALFAESNVLYPAESINVLHLVESIDIAPTRGAQTTIPWGPATRTEENVAAWEYLKERKLIARFRFTAATGESPCSEYTIMTITTAGRALLDSYGFHNYGVAADQCPRSPAT